MAGKINNQQIRLIHVGLRQLDIDEEQKKDMLLERYDCWNGSMKELNYDEASDFIDHLVSLGFRITPKKRSRRPKAPNTVEALFPGHPMLKKLEAIEADIQWKFQDGHLRFARKIIKKDRPLDTREGTKLMEALKGLLKNQEKAHG